MWKKNKGKTERQKEDFNKGRGGERSKLKGKGKKTSHHRNNPFSTDSRSLIFLEITH